MTLNGQTRDPNMLRAQYLENYLSYRLQIWCAALYQEYRADAQIIFPESGRGPGHVTPTIFGSTVGYLSDSLASCCGIAAVLGQKYARWDGDQSCRTTAAIGLSFSHVHEN